MENFLLIFDELDDLYAMAGLVWRPVFSFLAAVALFALTGFVFYRMPIAAGLLGGTLGGTLLTLGLIDAARERRVERPVRLVVDDMN